MVRMSLSVLGRATGAEGAGLALASRRLVDSRGRTIRDLRLSITDRCNFRCVYCMSPETAFLAREELLSVDELVRVARLCMGLGVERIRITGGEPTLHPGLEELIGALGVLGPRDLSLTTNGSRCTPGRLARWGELGLRRVTFSLDAATPEVFRAMTRSRCESGSVLRAVRDAMEAGLGPVKVNAVVIRGLNEGEIGPLTLLAREMGFEMRFIEFMPLDSGRTWDPGLLVPAEEILERAGAAAALEALGREEASSTSEVFAFRDGGEGRVGVIAPVTRPFCGACSRLRITADGQVRPCLFSLREFDLRDAMRAGETDRQLEERLLGAVWSKQAGHGIGRDGFRQPERGMSAIGG